jgi:circadian clock protein KaiC
MTDDARDDSATPDRRCPSGIEGLDAILMGGLPCNCSYLIQGDPGSGKTTLALQFLLEGVRRGDNTFYVTLSETKEELLKVARSHGWSLTGIPMLELSAIAPLVHPEAQTTVFHPSEIELGKVTRLLLAEIGKAKPARVVFDSLSEFRLMAETALRYRRQLLNLKQEFAKYGSTVLFLDDKVDNSHCGTDPHVMSLAHGVIQLEQLSPDYGRSRRRLRVLKMRGVKFREGYHDYVIERGGLRVFPRVVAAEHRGQSAHDPVSSGHRELDQLLGGGLDRGTTTLILGPAGSGKSTLAMQYAVQMATQGERSILFTFEEISSMVVKRAQALGLDATRHLERGVMKVEQVDPAEIAPGEFGMRILREVEAGCKLVIIDSLNGYVNAMPGEKYLNAQLHELSAYLNQQGVVSIFIVAQHGLVSAAEAPVDLSYLADTVISARFFEVAGSVKLALSVIKKRTGHHEHTIREFKMETGRGLRIGEPLKDFHGVLAGAPIYHGHRDRILGPSDAAD